MTKALIISTITIMVRPFSAGLGAALRQRLIIRLARGISRRPEMRARNESACQVPMSRRRCGRLPIDLQTTTCRFIGSFAVDSALSALDRHGLNHTEFLT
jgi:hypothetical protein